MLCVSGDTSSSKRLNADCFNEMRRVKKLRSVCGYLSIETPVSVFFISFPLRKGNSWTANCRTVWKNRYSSKTLKFCNLTTRITHLTIFLLLCGHVIISCRQFHYVISHTTRCWKAALWIAWQNALVFFACCRKYVEQPVMLWIWTTKILKSLSGAKFIADNKIGVTALFYFNQQDQSIKHSFSRISLTVCQFSSHGLFSLHTSSCEPCWGAIFIYRKHNRSLDGPWSVSPKGFSAGFTRNISTPLYAMPAKQAQGLVDTTRCAQYVSTCNWPRQGSVDTINVRHRYRAAGG